MWIANMAQGIIDAWNHILEYVTQLLTVNPTTDGIWASAWNVAETIHNGIKGIAIGLMVLFWSLSFFKYVDDIRSLDWREMCGWILRFAIIYALMEASMGIMQIILNVAMDANATIIGHVASNAIYIPEDVMAAFQSVNFEVNDIGSFFSQIGSFFSQIPMTLMYLVLAMAILVCGIIIVITVFVRFFKLYIYTAIAPIPLATFAGFRVSEMGRHFLKSWFAVCLQVCIMSIAIAIYYALVSGNTHLFDFMTISSENSVENFWNVGMGYLLETLVKSVLLAVVIRSSSRWIDKMLGT